MANSLNWIFNESKKAAEVYAALVAQTHRYRDQIGLSPAGLKENGWKIGALAPADSAPAVKAAPRRSSSKARLKVVSGGGG